LAAASDSLLYAIQGQTSEQIYTWDESSVTSTAVVPTLIKNCCGPSAAQTTISADGRFVAFYARPDGAAQPPAAVGPGSFLYDRANGSVTALYDSTSALSDVEWAPTGHRMLATSLNEQGEVAAKCSGIAPACEDTFWSGKPTDQPWPVYDKWSSDGRLLPLRTSPDSTLQVYDFTAHRMLRPSADQSELLAWTADHTAAITQDLGTAVISRWDLTAGTVIALSAASTSNDSLPSPDGSTLLTRQSVTDPVHRIDVASAKDTLTPIAAGAGRWNWSGDGARVYASTGKELSVWTAQTNTTATIDETGCTYLSGASASGRYAMVVASDICGQDPPWGYYQIIDLVQAKIVGSLWRPTMDRVTTFPEDSPWSAKEDMLYTFDRVDFTQGIDELIIVRPGEGS
jgi:hypothetical protein